MRPMTTPAQRRERLADARLYLVADGGMADTALEEALIGGVDMVQLRDRSLDDEALVARAAAWRALCDSHGALLWINDRPDLALRAGADGVHVGQGDAPIAEVREAVGQELLVGLSTHSVGQLEAGIAAGADELSVGPVWETPTKPGRPATGVEYVRAAAARRPPQPWFAIGGIDGSNVHKVLAAGAERVVVARAIRDAPDPRSATEWLRAEIEEGIVGSAQ
jgi:thiamine-phosphate pyrophosphorylase